MLLAYQKELLGKNIGIVFGSFAPLHQGHLDLIMRAKKENDGGCIVIVCGYENDKGEPLMHHQKRYQYVREFFDDDDLVAVYAINDTELGIAMYPNGWEKWLEEFNKIWDIAVENKTANRNWYVGEQDYCEGLTTRGENAILIDRTENLISATMIRQNPIKYWDKITYPFRRIFSTNILIVGTASEGKTEMTKDLGKYFNAPYSWEWARDYIKEKCLADWEFESTDFMAFLEGQHNLNQKLISSTANNGVFFADSDAMITRMYAEQYANEESCALTKEEFEIIAVAADEYARKSRWDKIYLLCPKGVFVDDHSRFMIHSGMEERQKLFEILCNNIQRIGDWDKVEILDGGYWKNFEKIVKDVKEIIENGKNS